MTRSSLLRGIISWKRMPDQLRSAAVDVSAWLQNLGLERYEPAFRDNEITAEVLPELTDADLRELGLPLGPRKVVLKAIAALRACSGSTDEAQADAAPEPIDRPRH